MSQQLAGFVAGEAWFADGGGVLTIGDRRWWGDWTAAGAAVLFVLASTRSYPAIIACARLLGVLDLSWVARRTGAYYSRLGRRRSIRYWDLDAHPRLRVHRPKTDCALCLSASYASRNWRAWDCEGWAMIVATLPPIYSEERSAPGQRVKRAQACAWRRLGISRRFWGWFL